MVYVDTKRLNDVIEYNRRHTWVIRRTYKKETIFKWINAKSV